MPIKSASFIPYRVQVFLFSGRPDPEWTLSPDVSQQWEELWANAALTGKEVQRPAVLGYTGCRLQLSGSGFWLVYNERVSYYDDNLLICKTDTNRRMEFLLLHSAPEETLHLLKQIRVI